MPIRGFARRKADGLRALGHSAGGGAALDVDGPHRSAPLDLETRIVEAGDAVIARRSLLGDDSLSKAERLVHCLWVADFGMRNAGDLETARDLHADFMEAATRLSAALGLPFSEESFGLSPAALQSEYFERLDRICSEIRSAIDRHRADDGGRV